MKPFLLFAVLFFSNSLFSQTTISGKIVDDKNTPIPNANIYIDGTYDGATSNNLGEFSFTTTAEGNQTLVISALSFEQKKNGHCDEYIPKSNYNFKTKFNRIK